MEDYWKAAEAPKKRKSENDKEALDVEDFVAGMNDARENGMEKLFEDKDVTDDLDNVADEYFDKNEEHEFEGINHEDFLRKDKGGAALKEGDQGFDEEMGVFSQNVADAEMELVDDISMAESDDNGFSSNRNVNTESVEMENRIEREVNEVKSESKQNDSRIQVLTEMNSNEINTQECQTSLFAEIDASIGYQYTPQCSQEGKKLLSSLKSTGESKIKDESCNTVTSGNGQGIKDLPQHKQDNEKKSKKSSSTPSLEKENEGSANSKNTVDDGIQTKTSRIVVTSSPSRRSVKPPKAALGKKRKADAKAFSSKKFLHVPSYLKGKK